MCSIPYLAGGKYLNLLQVEDLSTHLFTEEGVIRAVENVSLYIRPAEAVALVGESGCGKSMTALSLTRLVRPPGRILKGKILFKGRDLLAIPEGTMRKVRGREISMVFQDPMTFLNPLMRVGDQIAEGVRIHDGADQKDARERALEALRGVKIPGPENVILQYPHQLSGGMRQRVLIAIAIACHPSLLIADEPTTTLDVTVQAQIMILLSNLREELESSLFLITHDLGLVAEYCDRVYVMYAGRIVEESTVEGLFQAPLHPYSLGLLGSCISVDRRTNTFDSVKGQPPNLLNIPPGCAFHPRCPKVWERCLSEDPRMVEAQSGHWVRCWRYADG